MKFLSTMNTPKLTVTHRTRRQTITRTGQMILTESTTRIELTLPSFVTGVRQSWRTLKGDFNRFVRDIFVPIGHCAACA
jgi:hypothetical protein